MEKQILDFGYYSLIPADKLKKKKFYNQRLQLHSVSQDKKIDNHLGIPPLHTKDIRVPIMKYVMVD